MAQMCPAKSTIVPFKKQMYSSGSIILSYKDDKCICVSIHAPMRGATFLKLVHFEFSMFQSTHPRGVRLVCHGLIKFCCYVSIHAPTRGATKGIYYFGNLLHCFNPRTHEGCDVVSLKCCFVV